MTASTHAERGSTVRALTRALVLGGAGFLGSWVTRELAADRVEATVLGYGARRPRDAAIAITRASVEEALDATRYDAVFFLAGSPSVPRSLRDPGQDLHDNASLVVEVLEAIRSISPEAMFVFVSSAAVYGDSQQDPMEEDHPLLPRSPYGVSKLAAEHYVRLYADLHGISGISVRPFSVYGPGQRKLVIYDLTRRLLAREDPLIVQGPPEVARDFVYVRDVARAMIALCRCAPGCGECYNIASGKATTLEELVKQLLASTRTSAANQFTGVLRAGDPLRWRGGTRKLDELGVSCPTSLADGLAETVAWIRRDLADA